MRHLAALVLFAAAPAFAQTKPAPDPYAQDQVREAEAQYHYSRTLYLRQVVGVWFAEGCGVITELGAQVLTETYTTTIGPTYQVMKENDAELPGLVADVSSKGREHAKDQGACEYWHEHPDIVTRLRAKTGWEPPR